jgi:hypothetical protein
VSGRSSTPVVDFAKGVIAMIARVVEVMITPGKSYGEQLGPIVGEDAAKHLQTIDFRQLDIEKKDSWNLSRIAVGVTSRCEQVGPSRCVPEEITSE